VKQTLEIKRFLSGIISAPAEADIPVDAASYSLNVDPTTEDGKLGGVPDDLTKKTGVNATALALLEGSTTWTAIYVDPASFSIKGVSDFYGTPGSASFTGSATIAGTVVNPAMQTWNKSVRIGAGAVAPRWVGYIDTGQLNNPAPSGLQIEDAEVKAPGGHPGLYSIIRTSAGTFGIEWQGRYIYRITSAGVITRSARIFGATQGLCADYADADKLWVYDNDGNTEYGTLYKIDISELVTDAEDATSFVVLTAKIEDWDGGALSAAGDQVSDIEMTSTKMWFSVYRSTAITSAAAKFLFSATIPTTNGELVSTTNKSFRRALTGAPAIGYWAADATVTTSKRALMKFSSASIGYMCNLNGSVLYYAVSGPPNSCPFDSSVVIIPDSYTAEDPFTVDVCLPLQLTNVAGTEIDDVLVGPNLNTSMIATFVNDTDGTNLYIFDTGDISAALTSGTMNSGTSAPHYVNALAEETYTLFDHGAVAAYSTGLAFTLVESQDVFWHGNGTYTTGPYALSALGNQVIADVGISLEETTTAVTDSFDTTKTYFYRVSYVYDGSQESPLSVFSAKITPATGDKAIRASITMYNTSGFSQRITAVNLYRAEALSAGAGQPDTFYKLVTTLFFDYRNFGAAPSVAGEAFTGVHLDTFVTSVTYEANSGLPEDLERSIVYYGLAYTMNSEMIVGQCSVPGVPDAERMLFKSLPGQLDSFNTIDTFVLLKAKPTAVCGYNGRFYGFDTGKIYRVNPNPFVIEDVFEGVGCSWATAVVSTEYGMFHADENGIYMHNGVSPQLISYAVRDLWALKVTSTYAPKMVFDSVRRCLLVFHAIAGPAYRVLAYSLVHKGWWYWETVLPKALLRGKDGEVYVSNGTDLIEYLGGTGFRAYDWYSKGLTAGNDSIKKRWFSTRVQAEGTGGTWTGTLTFLADGSAVTPTTDHDGETFRFIHKAWAEKFQIKLDNMPGNDLIDSFGINIRQKVVTG